MEFKYGFQGQEGDDEIKGEGNSVNYKYRMHDPRIGRFFAVDPLAPKYPHNSPYAFSENDVIAHVELEGLEKAEPPLKNGKPNPNAGKPDFKSIEPPTPMIKGPGGREVPNVLLQEPIPPKNETTVTFPDDYPSMKTSTGFEVDLDLKIEQVKARNLLRNSAMRDFGVLGQSLQYAPEAATLVFAPEWAGAKLGNYFYKASSWANKVNLAERTLNVGMNYYGQTITDKGNMNFSTKDQLSLGLSFISPVKLKFGVELSANAVSSQFEYTYQDGFDGFWNRSGKQNMFNLLRSGINTGLNSEDTKLFVNPWINKSTSATLDGLLGIPSNQLGEKKKN